MNLSEEQRLFFARGFALIVWWWPIIVLLLSQSLPATCQTSCGLWSSCYSCTIEGGCGWCSTGGGACEAGNASNSFLGCANSSWVWLPSNCSVSPQPSIAPPPLQACSSAESCATCTILLHCGWCSFTGQCQRGNATGSFHGCTVPYWSWTEYQCPNTPGPAPLCNYYNGYCHTCKAVRNCGYCSSTGMCEVGNASGSFGGDCTGSRWIWGVNATCPTYRETKVTSGGRS